MTVTSKVDASLGHLQGVTDVYQEDREFFHISYNEGQELPELIRRIDARMTELSDLAE